MKFISLGDDKFRVVMKSNCGEGSLSLTAFSVRNAEKEFKDIDPVISNKYGHLIRSVKNLKTQEQVDSLLCIKDLNLSALSIAALLQDSLLVATCHDLIRDNQSSLIEFSVRNTDTSRTLTIFISLYSLTPMIKSPQSSQLTSLSIENLTMTRKSFTSILRSCQGLVEISIWGTTLTPSLSFDHYQHTGVSDLTALPHVIFDDKNPTILVHFPNLKVWRTGDTSELAETQTQKISEFIIRWCPKLDSLTTWGVSEPIITLLFTDIIPGLSHLEICNNDISSNLILTLMRFSTRWMDLRIYLCEPEVDTESFELSEDGDIPEIEDVLESSGWMIQLLLNTCTSLKSFALVLGHEMDLDDIEKVPWGCIGLKSIMVRIKGLDTWDGIDRVIRRLIEANRQRRSKKPIDRPYDHDSLLKLAHFDISFNLKS
ncbi:hypothetical protein BGZ49_001763 [Haplosporangium sp. Z 27]|nr:hypothetical protein BGZ49_001763 [Haplosporangium sp. Z 27]